jgi:hypothetical protein
MSQLPDLQQKFGCGQNGCGQNDGLCPTCAKSFTDSTDVVPLQTVRELCSDCKSNPIPSCQVCATIKMTKKAPPFTKEDVEQLYAEMMNWFLQSPNYSIKLTVSKNSMLIGRIDWTMNNCAFSVLVLMLSSSNAGLNSINQQTFAGYILAIIINSIQETGSCDPIVLEVFRLKLTILSKNPVWSNWSGLVEYHKLYNLCVEYKIIIADEVEFVPSNDDGSNVKKALNGKCGSTLVGAYKWSPSIYVLANGILSADICSKHRVKAVGLHKDNHFFIIILVDGGFFLIDGKGKRIEEFKAQSTLHQLTIDQFQELCAAHGAFYLFEEVPFVYEKQAIPPQSALSEDVVCAFQHRNPVPRPQISQVPPPPPPAPSAQSAQAQQQKVVVWFFDNYYSYDPENKVLRTILTGFIMEGIQAGTYEVREKETHRIINIELREVQSNYALPPPAPRAQVFRKIQLTDITIRDGVWSIRRDSFFQTGTCTVSLNQYILGNVCYGETNFLDRLNRLYKKTVQ